MGIITIIMIALSAVALVFGVLYGMGRGRNRSILRLILIIGCIVGAIFLREPVINFLMEIEVGPNETFYQMLTTSLAGEVPQGFGTFILVLVAMILNLIVYFILFFVLRIVSWLILFPILKIFVKTEVDKRRGAGAIIGLIQGIVIIFAVLVPLNGLAIQMDKLSQIKMETSGEQTSQESGFSLEIPAELGLSEYTKFGLCNVYDTIGDWYFDKLTTVELYDSEINLGDMCDVAVGLGDFVSSTSDMADCFSIIKNGAETKQEIIDILVDRGAKITSTGVKMDKMNKGAKTLLIQLLEGVLSEQAGQNINLGNMDVTALGYAFTVVSNYYENQTLTQEQAKIVINGIAKNWSLVELLNDNSKWFDASGETENNLKSALEELGITDLEQKNQIMFMLGITA